MLEGQPRTLSPQRRRTWQGRQRHGSHLLLYSLPSAKGGMGDSRASSALESGPALSARTDAPAFHVVGGREGGGFGNSPGFDYWMWASSSNKWKYVPLLGFVRIKCLDNCSPVSTLSGHSQAAVREDLVHRTVSAQQGVYPRPWNLDLGYIFCTKPAH